MSSPRRSFGIVPFVVFGALAACSSGSTSVAEDDIQGGALAGGPELDAVGGVSIDGVTGCGATLVEPQVALSAAHCLVMGAQSDKPKVVVRFKGKNYRVKAQVTTGPAGIGAIGTGRDAAIYLLETPVLDVQPMRIRVRPLDESDVGHVFTVVGNQWAAPSNELRKGPMTLGAVSGNPYAKRFGTEAAYVDYVKRATGHSKPATPFADAILSPAAYEVHAGLAEGDAQPCSGDSGGPLLDRVGDHYELVGVTSSAENSYAKCILGAVFAATGPKILDALARVKAAASAPAVFCPGYENGGRADSKACSGDEVVSCSGSTNAAGTIGRIRLDDCGDYGNAPLCESSASSAKCRHEPSHAPVPWLAQDPEAIVQLAPPYVLRRGGRVDKITEGAALPFEKITASLGKSVSFQKVVDVVGLSLTETGAYALRKDGTILFWGSEHDVVGAALIAPTKVFSIPGAVELSGTCTRLASGQVSCFTHDAGKAPSLVNGLASVVQIAGYKQYVFGNEQGYHCARRANGSVACWGGNTDGRLGAASDVVSSDVPLEVAGLHDAIDIATGRRSACAVRATGAVVCWGRLSEQLVRRGAQGHQDVIVRSPTPLLDIADAVRTTVEDYSTDSDMTRCALRAGGRLTCWATSTGSRDIREVEGAAAVAVWSGNACSVRADGRTLWCWGWDTKTLFQNTPGFNESSYTVPQPIRL